MSRDVVRLSAIKYMAPSGYWQIREGSPELLDSLPVRVMAAGEATFT